MGERSSHAKARDRLPALDHTDNNKARATRLEMRLLAGIGLTWGGSLDCHAYA